MTPTVRKNFNYSYSPNSKTSLDEFAGQVLETACEKGTAYLWRVDNQLRVFGQETGFKINGTPMSNLVRSNRAQFLGNYNANARGEDILNDVRFEMDALLRHAS